MIRQIAETGKTVPLCDVIRRLVENGAFDKAEREAARAMSEAPHAPEPHNLMGIILENENDHIGAMKHFRAAWALDPTYLPARFNMEQYGRFSAVERGEGIVVPRKSLPPHNRRSHAAAGIWRCALHRS